MKKITKKQIADAERVICEQVKDPYARQEVLCQLYWQLKTVKKLERFWKNIGEPPMIFCVRGQINIPLSQEVCRVLGLP